MKKHCSKCKTIKNVKDFYKNKHRKDGLTEWCKPCCKNKSNNYYLLNKEKVKKYQQTENYKIKKKEYKKRSRKKYKASRKKRDINYKILENIRARVYSALKNNYKKATKTRELLGNSIESVRQHLESEFADGMTWENYGKWHIDHIIPCSSFNFNDPEQQRKCFNYTNLQPLWATDNLKKSNKIKI